MSDTPRTSAEWRIIVGDAKPPLADTHAFSIRTIIEPLISDLAASERSDAIHLEALAESERLRTVAEFDSSKWREWCDEWRVRAERAEAERDELDTECTNRQLRIYALEADVKALTADLYAMNRAVENGHCPEDVRTVCTMIIARIESRRKA